jgi:hypothetical protein
VRQKNWKKRWEIGTAMSIAVFVCVNSADKFPEENVFSQPVQPVKR